MAAHTPGPWKHDKMFPNCVWSGDVWVGSANVESNESPEARTANARLMAAAPTMLEALKVGRDELFGTCYFDQSVMDAMDAAIKLAEGGE